MKTKLVFSNGYLSDITNKGWGISISHHDDKQDAITELKEYERLCNKNGRIVLLSGPDYFTFRGPYSHGELENICTYAVLDA